jgi:hypothetical protein
MILESLFGTSTPPKSFTPRQGVSECASYPCAQPCTSCAGSPCASLLEFIRAPVLHAPVDLSVRRFSGRAEIMCTMCAGSPSADNPQKAPVIHTPFLRAVGHFALGCDPRMCAALRREYEFSKRAHDWHLQQNQTQQSKNSLSTKNTSLCSQTHKASTAFRPIHLCAKPQ